MEPPERRMEPIVRRLSLLPFSPQLLLFYAGRNLLRNVGAEVKRAHVAVRLHNESGELKIQRMPSKMSFFIGRNSG